MIPVPTVTDAARAFPVSEALGELPEKIPDTYDHQVKWDLFFRTLFFVGLRTGSIGLLPREGVKAEDAWRALEVLIGVRDMKHQRKEALWSYLASQWFTDCRWETIEGETITFEDADFDAAWVKKEADGV